MSDAFSLACLVSGLVLAVVELAWPGRQMAPTGLTLGVLGLVGLAWPPFFDAPYVLPLVAAPLLFAAAFFAWRAWAPGIARPLAVRVVGRVGEVVSAGDQGLRVRVDGLVWPARGDGAFAPGARVEIEAQDGNLLRVRLAPATA